MSHPPRRPRPFIWQGAGFLTSMVLQNGDVRRCTGEQAGLRASSVRGPALQGSRSLARAAVP